MTNIMYVIHGTSQMGLENDFPLVIGSHSLCFRKTVSLTGSRRVGLRHSMDVFHSRHAEDQRRWDQRMASFH